MVPEEQPLAAMTKAKLGFGVLESGKNVKFPENVWKEMSPVSCVPGLKSCTTVKI